MPGGSRVDYFNPAISQADASEYRRITTSPGSAHSDSAFTGLTIGTLAIVGTPLMAVMFGPTAAALGSLNRIRFGLYVAGAGAIYKDATKPTGPDSDIPVYSPSQIGALTGVTPTRTTFSRLVRLVGHSAFAWWVYSSTMEHEESRRTKAAIRRKKSRSGYRASGRRHFKHH